MPGKSNNCQQTDKEWKPLPTGAIRKSILRNPEVPLRKSVGFAPTNEYQQKNPTASRRHTASGFSQNEVAEVANSKLYHEPKINKIGELRKNLNELKSYEMKTLESINDLTQNSKNIVNSKISSKLNFPQHQQIFKNLPKLEEEVAQKASKLVQKSARKVAEDASKRRSLEVREEISDLIKELMDLEYKKIEEGGQTPKVYQLPTENEFLGLTKFSSPNFCLTNKRFETQRYIDSIAEEANRQIFRSEVYLEARKWESVLDRPAPNKPENNCNCLAEFYDVHSTCQ